MKAFWAKLKTHRILTIIFLVLSFLTLIYHLFLRANMTHIFLVGFDSSLMLIFLGIILILGGLLWVLLSPNIHRVLLLAALAVTTLGLYTTTLGGNIYYALGGFVLIVLAAFFPLNKKRPLFLIVYPLYYALGCFFFGFLEWGHFILHVLGFFLAALSMYVPDKKLHYVLAGGSLVFPALVFSVIAILSFSDFSSNSVRSGTIESPFSDAVLYVQKDISNFDETLYELEIYRPKGLGFYKKIGVHASMAYLPPLTTSDFNWESIDETTYRLHFYEVDGVMQYSITVNV